MDQADPGSASICPLCPTHHRGCLCEHWGSLLIFACFPKLFLLLTEMNLPVFCSHCHIFILYNFLALLKSFSFPRVLCIHRSSKTTSSRKMPSVLPSGAPESKSHTSSPDILYASEHKHGLWYLLPAPLTRDLSHGVF